LRVLVLFAHPVETSFVAATHTKLAEVLRAKGHTVDDCDLYAEAFDPVMSRQDRIDYHNVAVNRRNVAFYVDRLLAAEALVFSFPVWNMGFPAILKGFVDRVFLPGVSFTLDEGGSYNPCLHNIKRLGVVCTYGGARWLTFMMGDPPRRFLTRDGVFGDVLWGRFLRTMRRALRGRGDQSCRGANEAQSIPKYVGTSYDRSSG